LYVLGTDVDKNILYVGEGSNHPGLFRKALFIENSEVHWLRDDLQMKSGEAQSFDFRIRYRQPLQKGQLIVRDEGAYIEFDEWQRGVTPGQFAAWYKEGELLGSGPIYS
jgi:tRNA-specific 2-thiouridylase